MNTLSLAENMLYAVLGPTAIAVTWPLPHLIIFCTAAQIVLWKPYKVWQKTSAYYISSPL